MSKQVFFRNNEGDIKYVVGENHKGWIVKRINNKALDSDGEETTSIASELNNKAKKPALYDECELLKYE